MTVQIEGEKEVARNLEALADKYGKATVEAATQAGQLIRSEAIRSIQSKSGGEEVTRYRLGGGQYTHTASAPGDAPNTDTGRLVASIQVEQTMNEIYVGSSLEYAGYLEYGTVSMDARPWLTPATESKRREIFKLFGIEVGKVTKEANK